MYQLGVDIGTSANAMYAFSIGDDGLPQKHLWHELMIFGEPVTPEKGELKNLGRRTARISRRRLARKVSRVKKVWHLAKGCGVDSSEADKFAIETFTATEGYKTTGTERIWELRARAAREKIPLPALFYVAASIAKHRGYNAIAPQKATQIAERLRKGSAISTDDRKTTSYGLCVTAQWKAEHPGQTPAEILLAKKLSGEIRSFLNIASKKSAGDTPSGFKNPDLYSFHRQDYIEELSLIIDEQVKHHPVLSEPVAYLFRGKEHTRSQLNYFWGRTPGTIGDAIKLCVFYQYPRKSFEGLIGPCSLEPSTDGKKNKRIVMAHPSAERFRAAKVAGDMRWKGKSGTEPLSPEQRALLIDLSVQPWKYELTVSSTSKIDISDFYLLLEKEGIPRPSDKILAIDTLRQRKLSVSNHKKAFEPHGIWEVFSASTYETKCRFFEAWADVVGESDTWGFDCSREEVMGRFGLEVVEIFDKLVKSNGAIPSLSEMGLRDGRMSYGQQASDALYAYMMKAGVDEYAAKEALYPQSVVKSRFDALKTKSDFNRAIPKIVPPDTEVKPGEYAIEVTNPTVRRSLQELRRAMIRKFTKFGPPSSVTLELSREAKANKKERDSISSMQREQEEMRDAAAVALKSLGLKVSKENILRTLLLWEQGCHCPYTGDTITLLEAIDGRIVHKDHIAPRAAVHNANARRFLVLTKSGFNLEKSNSPTIYHHFVSKNDIQGFKDLEARLKHVEKNFPYIHAGVTMRSLLSAFRAKKDLILRRSAYGEEQSDESFAERQLVETSYIGRVAQQMFDSVCPHNVLGSRGKLTALVRGDRMLRAETIIPDDLIKKGVIPTLDGIKKSRSDKSAIDNTLKRIKEAKEKGMDSLAEALEHKAKVLDEEPCGLYYERRGGHRHFNKRADHRQHLVDACAIALSSRKLLHAILEEERRAAMSKTEPDYNNIKAKFIPISAREDLNRIVANFVVMGKPDRLGGGALLKATANSLSTRNPEICVDVLRTDRNGVQYGTAYEYAGIDYAVLSTEKDPKSGENLSRIARFDKETREVSSHEVKVFRGDLLMHRETREIWRIGYFRSSKVIKCVRPSIAYGFNEVEAANSAGAGGTRSISFSTAAKEYALIKDRFNFKNGS